MYADREPRVSRHVQIEYKTNAAEFGMGKQRHRSRSPFRRAVTRSGQRLFLRVYTALCNLASNVVLRIVQTQQAILR